MAHCACKNAEMNLKSTTTNGFNFRIINSLKYAWPGLTVMKHGKFRFLRWRRRLREFVPMELSDPEKNKSVQLLLVFCNRLLDKQGLNAMVTVWLTSQNTPISYNVFDNAGHMLSKTAVNYVIPTRIVWQFYDFRIHLEIWKLNRQTVSRLPKLSHGQTLRVGRSVI